MKDWLPVRLWLWLLLPLVLAAAVPAGVILLRPQLLADAFARRTIAAASIGIAILVAGAIALYLARAQRALSRVARDLAKGRLESRAAALPAVAAGLVASVNALGEQLLHDAEQEQTRTDQATRKLREDLHRLRAQNKALETTLREARGTAQSKSALLASMSHELRTPLTAILGFADLLRRTELSREQGDYLSTLEKSARGLLAMINDLLDWSRIESGRLTLHELGFNLADCIEDTIALMAPLAYEKQLELVHILYHDVPLKLRGDPARLQQVLTNLLSNAIKFTDRGEIALRVMKERESGNRVWLRINVTDTGRGLSAAQQQRLFEDFTPASRPESAAPSSGLGLSITRRLLRLMDGDIEVESRPGEGAQFSVVFAMSLPADREAEAGALPGLRGLRAWLFEPHPTTRLALLHSMEYWGVALKVFDSAGDLNESLRYTGQWPDLVVLGLRPRDLDEPTMVTILDQCRDTTPLLALLSSVETDVLERARTLGASRALPKSASRRQLYRELSALGRGESGDEAPLPALHDKTVVLADNALTGRRFLTAMLDRLGAHSFAAADGEEALALWARERPGVVLLDIHMPNMNGLEASRAIRAREGASRQTLIIAVSAHLEPEERQAVALAGIDDVLIKPFDERQLLRALAPYLRATREPPRETAALRATEKLAGDPELLSLLEEDLPNQLRELEDAYTLADADAIRSAAHQIHGTAAFYRLKNLREAAAQLESRATQTDGTDTSALAEALAGIRAAVYDTLRAIRESRRR